MQPVLRCLLLGLLAPLALARGAGAVTFEWVEIGEPDNPPDTPSHCFAADCGSVAEPFWIARYPVTNAQYAEFLNAKAASDPLGLYSPFMTSLATGGIVRSGIPGSFLYAPKPDFEAAPVNFLNFWSALRFINWLHNGQADGDTETGAYTLVGGQFPANTGVGRNPGARAFLPSENEWYKAAYYDPVLGDYYDYPAGSDAVITCSLPSLEPNRANCGNAVLTVTSVGAYPASESPWGTLDQGGNVWEWNEQIVPPANRGTRGGAWASAAEDLAASAPDSTNASALGSIGFRVAMPAPEPAASGPALLTLAGLAVRRRGSGRSARARR